MGTYCWPPTEEELRAWRPRSRRGPGRPPVPKEKIREVLYLHTHNPGMSPREIAREVGLGRTTVYTIIQEED